MKLDYGDRQYYAPLLTWDRVDPLCEKYYHISPYAYCGNNPVNAIDKEGREFEPWLFLEEDARGHAIGIPYTSMISFIGAMTEIGRTKYGQDFLSSFILSGMEQYGVKGNG